MWTSEQMPGCLPWSLQDPQAPESANAYFFKLAVACMHPHRLVSNFQEGSVHVRGGKPAKTSPLFVSVNNGCREAWQSYPANCPRHSIRYSWIKLAECKCVCSCMLAWLRGSSCHAYDSCQLVAFLWVHRYAGPRQQINACNSQTGQ